MGLDDDEEAPLAVAINDVSVEERAIQLSDLPEAQPVGVTVITGYLGAGKSTVVDAKNLRYQLKSHHDSSSFPEAYHQIAFADVVILNKVDLLVSSDDSGVHLEDLENDIRNINSLAIIIRSIRCQVDFSVILNCQAYDATAHATHLEALLKESQTLSTSDIHDSGVRTLCICEPRTVDLEKVKMWIEEILWDKKYGMDVYRCKGILSVLNSDQLYTLQDAMEKAIKNKVAKAVVPAIDVMFQAMSEFGSKVVPPKRLLKMLPELFDHQECSCFFERADTRALSMDWKGSCKINIV